MTLIELLVVVVIVISLTAVAVPIIAPSGDARRQRESARAVSAFIASARARAIEIGRPAGIWLEGLPGDPVNGRDARDRETIVSMSACEVPPPYSGETFDTVVVYQHPMVPLPPNVPPHLLLTSFVVRNSGALVPPKQLVRVGDLIVLNNRQLTFRIADGPVDSQLPEFLGAPSVATPWTLEPIGTPVPLLDSSDRIVIADGAAGVPFQIIRQPRKSAAGSVELPEGAVIDLFYSGESSAPLLPRSLGDTDNRNYAGSAEALHKTSSGGVEGHNEPVILLFSPNGTPDSIFHLVATNDPATDYGHLDWVANSLTEPLFLLVGKVENLPVTDDDPVEPDPLDGNNLKPTMLNAVDPDNYWVAINPQTGVTTVAEVSLTNYEPNGLPSVLQRLRDSRAFALQALGVGGR